LACSFHCATLASSASGCAAKLVSPARPAPSELSEACVVTLLLFQLACVPPPLECVPLPLECVPPAAWVIQRRVVSRSGGGKELSAKQRGVHLDGLRRTERERGERKAGASEAKEKRVVSAQVAAEARGGGVAWRGVWRGNSSRSCQRTWLLKAPPPPVTQAQP